MSTERKRYVLEAREHAVPLTIERLFQSGLSCLHIAAAMGHADIVEILCDHGANVDQQFRFEEQDVTAFDLAESQQHDHVCQVLRHFGAQQPYQSTLAVRSGANN